jgi:tryptophan synthase alpha chain
MSRIASSFRRCSEQREGLLAVYLTAGYPDERACEEYVRACVQGGADLIEIGVPFSDPVADGPTIQQTSQLALEGGMTPMKVFRLVRRLRPDVGVPFVLMGYYNPIFRIGESRFAEHATRAGTDGLIVADLPFEESGTLREACAARSLDLIQLVGPTTSARRMERIASSSAGFLYLVTRLGATGEDRRAGAGLPALVAQAKRAAGTLPLAAGFGVSSPRQVREVLDAGADGVIVGSALLRRIIEGASPGEARAFIHDLKDACREGPSR